MTFRCDNRLCARVLCEEHVMLITAARDVRRYCAVECLIDNHRHHVGIAFGLSPNAIVIDPTSTGTVLTLTDDNRWIIVNQHDEALAWTGEHWCDRGLETESVLTFRNHEHAEAYSGDFFRGE